MSTAGQNADNEKRENTDLSKDEVSKQDLEMKEEGFGSFQGFDTGFIEENLPLVEYSEALQDEASGNMPRRGFTGLDASQWPSAKSETSFNERTDIGTPVSTTSEGQSTSEIGIRDIKKKIPGLADLILPTTPATPRYERNADSVSSSDSDVDQVSSPVIQPLLRRISISAQGRLKTRLQDPPPLTPAVQSQLTHCSSSMLHRRASLLAANEQQNARPEDVSAGIKTSSESNQTNTAIPIPNLSGSFNKNSNTAPPVPEEEYDPLDDDIIPASKKRKTQESTWGIYLQWIILLLLIAFLACSIKIKLLNAAKFLGLDLWRWVALTVVVFCGRLMSGWIMKLLEVMIEKHYILKKRVLYFVYGLKRAVKNCVWLALVLAVWESIFRGIEDTAAVNILTKVLAMTLFIVFFLIFGVETSKLLVFFSSVFIPSVFVFGNSARTTFESLIFLFVTHPFDVGDRIVVDGQNMLVEEMNVLNTIFLGPTNEKVYFPNALLSMKAISNYYRSPDQGDAIEFQIHFSTPVEKLGILKERMQRYIESLPQFWYPDFRIVCDKIVDSNKMNLNIWIRHRLNYQDGGERYQRRSNMLLYLKQLLEDLGIGYQLPGQEITVTGIPLISSPSLPS